jgi:transposase-like protein
MGIIKPERSEAFRLFEAGLSPVEVAKKITSVNTVTIYRWYKEYQQERIPLALPRDRKPIEKIEKVDLGIKENLELLQSHRKARESLFEHLEEMLNQPTNAVPWRAVAIASSLVCKHTELEYKVGGYAYQDINRAVNLLFSLGYEVVDNSENE